MKKINKKQLSVITVVFNASSVLERTILSVIEQNCELIEYIVIDGGSTDLTIQIINKYKEHIDYFISEHDNGIYDAMNKGIKVSSCNSLLFLNAGDYFVGNVLSKLNFNAPALIPVKYLTRSGKLKDFKIRSYKLAPPYCHQGTIFENKGLLYNTKYKIAADYDFYLRHGYIKLPFLKTDGYVSYDNEGVSTSQYLKKYDEIGEIIKKNFPLFNYYYYKSISILKHFIKTILRVVLK